MQNRVSTMALAAIALLVGTALTAQATESPYGDSSCVEYDREGSMFLVRNDCDAPGEGCTRQRLSLEEAIQYAKRYRWIDVSASMKREGHGLWEAELKLLGSGAEALVYVYLPQGVDEMACGGIGTAWIIKMIALYYYEDYPVDHPRFQERFGALVDGATEGGRQILITSKSYGGHQTLEAVHANPNVYHLSIAPSFGAFKDTHGDVQNPHVPVYIDNLRNTRAKECIVTSLNDCWSLFAHGSALSLDHDSSYSCDDPYNPDHPDPHPGTTRCQSGDDYCYIYGNRDVYNAIYANPEQVKTVLVDGSGHYTTSYYDHGLIDAMRSCPAEHGLEDDSVIAEILNGAYPHPGLTVTIGGEHEIADREVIYLAEDGIPGGDTGGYAAELASTVPNSYLNTGHTVPIHYEAFAHGSADINLVSFYEDRRDLFAYAPAADDAQRIGPDFNFQWHPWRDFEDNPSMVGRWMTVSAAAFDGGPLFPMATDARRVLIMRMVGETFPQPIPDITRLAVPREVYSMDAPLLTTSIYLPEPARVGGMDLWIDDQLLASATDAARLGESVEDGYRRYTLRATWNVRATWCRAYPADVEMCGSPSAPAVSKDGSSIVTATSSGSALAAVPTTQPKTLTVTISAVAWNSDGSSVTRTLRKTIERATTPLEALGEKLQESAVTAVEVTTGVDETTGVQSAGGEEKYPSAGTETTAPVSSGETLAVQVEAAATTTAK
ncbi:MAG: hypothetical protein HYV63_27310 [Candidatus Schekmanbacteria bacterium]|nr:hypothetical protein [Candidatus Schekmanbacteria bacterium]